MLECLFVFRSSTTYQFYIDLTTLFKNLDQVSTYFLSKIFSAAFFHHFLKYFVIPFLLLFILYLVILLLADRYLFERLTAKKKSIENILNSFLIEIIFSEHPVVIKEKIKSLKKKIPFHKKWCKHLILDKLINIKQNVQGEHAKRILSIYKYFGLQHYSKKLLSSRKWYHTSLGIYHYQALEYKTQQEAIEPYIMSRNRQLRSNALVALISLSDKKFDILNGYTENISEADELKILDIIYQNKSTLPESVHNWLYNKNNSLVTLGLKLIVRYRATLTIVQLDHLLNNTDVEVRRETYRAIRELILIEANDLLMNRYLKEKDKQCRVFILRALTAIGNHQTIRFASEFLIREKDMELRFEIIKCLNKIDKESILYPLLHQEKPLSIRTLSEETSIESEKTTEVYQLLYKPIESTPLIDTLNKDTLNNVSDPVFNNMTPMKSRTETSPHISKYDDTIPYSFLWWLHKTCQHYPDTYQPYVTRKPDTTQDINKNTVEYPKYQIMENIFHIHILVSDSPRTYKKLYVDDESENDLIKRMLLHVNNPYLN